MAVRASLTVTNGRQPTIEELLGFIDESGVFVDYQQIVFGDGHCSSFAFSPFD